MALRIRRPPVPDAAALASFSPEQSIGAGLFDSPRWICDEERYCGEPGRSRAPHAHAESDRIYVVLTGHALATLGGGAVEVGPGQVLRAASDECHGIAYRSPERSLIVLVMTPNPPSSGRPVT